MQVSAPPEFDNPAIAYDALVIGYVLLKNELATQMLETNSLEARRAALGATRQMIAEDSFGALVVLLIDCKAVPRNVMAATLDRLADSLIAKARGELETNCSIYPAEIFDRVRDLSAHAARLRQ